MPNLTLSENWYNGKFRIDHLILHSIAIAVIEKNAFKSRAFFRLSDLHIFNLIHVHRFDVATFVCLPGLNDLIIHEIDGLADNFPIDLFVPMTKSLHLFEYIGRIGTAAMLSNLFGNQPLRLLTYINIDCDYDDYGIASISAANFSGLTAVRTLSIVACGLESIAIDTFDQISATLSSIQLEDNPLTHVTLETFRVYFDRRIITRNVYRKEIVLTADCSPEFYQIRNASMISFGYWPDTMVSNCWQGMQFIDVRHQEPTARQNEHINTDQQIIHVKHFHLNGLFGQNYVFRKFQLNGWSKNRSVLIVQPDRNRFRLLVWVIGSGTMTWRRKCPMAAAMQCYLLNGTHHLVDFSSFDLDLDKVAMCIIHISMRKQSLPLHCITIKLTMLAVDDVLGFLHIFIGIILVVFLFVWVFGCLCIVGAYIWDRMRRNDELRPQLDR